MLYSNFYFVVQMYTTEIVVQYVWGIAIAAGMLFVTELMALMMGARKDMRVDMGGVSRIWDPVAGRRHPLFCPGGNVLLLYLK